MITQRTTVARLADGREVRKLSLRELGTYDLTRELYETQRKLEAALARINVLEIAVSRGSTRI